MDTDFGTLQHSCPEACIFIDFLEKRTLPVESKWKRRVENDANDYFMKDGKLWINRKVRGKRQTFQEEIIQIVVPISERNGIMHGYHTNSLAHYGFDKTYIAVSRVYFWHNMYKMLKNFIHTCRIVKRQKAITNVWYS